MSANPLPLAAAQRRNCQPGRPRKAPLEERAAAAVSTEGRRLLDVEGVAFYLSVSPRIVRELKAAGHLRPVVLPLGTGRELRKLLFDIVDVAAFIERSKSTEGVEERSHPRG